ncbi:hypothetical protein Bhyg_07875, partial [Pseudolycoriella hygida]
MSNSQVYKKLYKSYLDAYPNKSKAQVQIDMNKIWNENKKLENGVNIVLNEITELNKKAISRTLALRKFWTANIPAVPSKKVLTANVTSTATDATVSDKFVSDATVSDATASDETSVIINGSSPVRMTKEGVENVPPTSYPKPVQNAIQKRIDLLNADLTGLYKRQSFGMLSLEQQHIATYGAGAHERRRSDVHRCIKSLDELCVQLQNDGFRIKRGALYLRLLPRRSDSTEGKRHVVTVPVKLLKAHNDSHKSHIDGRFCTASIRSVEELSSFLGPNEVLFMSNDDKARVTIGLTAAKHQAPMLMHVEYKITLPDHDWVVAGKHKLIASVYAGIVIKPDGLGKPEAVGHSGPTFVAIRSGKHSSSNAFTHCFDIQKVIEMPEFESLSKHNGKVKPTGVRTKTRDMTKRSE